jgi:hypothetical protein
MSFVKRDAEAVKVVVQISTIYENGTAPFVQGDEVVRQFTVEATSGDYSVTQLAMAIQMQVEKGIGVVADTQSWPLTPEQDNPNCS